MKTYIVILRPAGQTMKIKADDARVETPADRLVFFRTSGPDGREMTAAFPLTEIIGFFEEGTGSADKALKFGN